MYNSGNPTLTNCTFGYNTASAYKDEYDYSYGGSGGGMCNTNGSPTLTDCTFIGNKAAGGGGISTAFGSPVLTNCTFTYNTAEQGGGISNYSEDEDVTSTLINCTFTYNTAEQGAGMANEGSPTLTNCTFSHNTAVSYDEYYAYEYAAKGGGLFSIGNPTLTDCTFSYNTAGYDYEYGTFSGFGGGMFSGTGSPTLTSCTFSHNAAFGYGDGGGISHYDEAYDCWDGEEENTHVMALTNCTLSDNTAYYGGGIVSNKTNCNYCAAVALTNCTLSGNNAAEGGAIYLCVSGLKMEHCTVTQNTASESAGGLYCYGGGFKNTIIAANTGGDYPDIEGYDVTSAGHNLIGNVGNYNFDTNTAGDQYGDPNNTTTPNTGASESSDPIDPKLDLLYNNGGFTKTHALQYGSPAIDAGDNTDAPDTDQRGFARIVNDVIDIGAFESGTDLPDLPMVSVEPGISADENGEISGTFILTRTRNTASALTVGYTLSGTATPGSDYTSTSPNPVTFAPGAATATITLNIANEGTADPNETIILTIANSSDYAVANSSATLTIADDVKVFYAEACGTGSGKAWNDTAELRDILKSGILDSGDQIWVKQGTYYPTHDDNPTIHFELVSGVEMYGGFSGFSASTVLSDRDPKIYSTVLSGDIGTRGVETDNSFHVVAALDSSIDADTVLDGFTITGGYSDGVRSWADDQITPDPKGGGMLILDASPTVKNCNFVRNTAHFRGGGLYAKDGNATITDCTFIQNACHWYIGGGESNGSEAWGGGGGICAYGITLTNCTFSHNSADGSVGDDIVLDATGGGGILEDCIVTNCIFTNNSGIEGGGAHQGYFFSTFINCTFASNSATRGGGICGRGTFTNCTFTDNFAGRGGGFLGGLSTLTNCAFSNNSAYYGGGLLGGELTLIDCTFSNNSAEVSGGGMRSSASSTLTNCTFSNNTANDYGGGIWNGANEYDWEPINLILQNCTMTNNTASQGGGIWNGGTNEYAWEPINLILQNCTVANNTATLEGGGIFSLSDEYSSATPKNSIIAGNTGGDYPDIQGSITSGGHNLIGSVGSLNFDSNTAGDQYGDPSNTTMPNDGAAESPEAIDPRLEALADNGGFTQTHALLPDSPAINAGDNTDAPDTDQRGEPRILNDIIDIGAFESSLRPLTRVSVAPGDTPDENGTVSGTFILTRTGDTTGPLSVSYTLTGTATGADYTNASGNPVTFSAGADTVTVTLTPVKDSDTDPDETVILTLSESSDYIAGDSASATLIISDDVTVFYAEAGGTGTGRAWNDTAELRDILKNGILDSGDAIWVKAGTYYPTADGDASVSFRLVSGVKIYGGFAEFTETAALADRDPATHVTLLSGLVGEGLNSDNVVTADSTVSSDTLLDGLTVADGGNGLSNSGAAPTVNNCIFTRNMIAGVYNEDADPSFTDCTFEENGGGMSNVRSNPDISNCVFSNNLRTGGMSNEDSSPVVSGSDFTDNEARLGGGIYNKNSSPIVNDCEFAGNIATVYEDEGGYGGGMFNTRGEPRVFNCVFTDNRAAYSGGAIFNENTRLSLKDSDLENNIAHGAGDEWKGGGAIFNTGSTVEIIRCEFTGNKVSTDDHSCGGAVYNFSGDITVSECQFTENSVTTVASEYSPAFGGAVYNSVAANAAIADSIFSRNTAEEGGAVANYSSSAAFSNCQFIENSAEADDDAESGFGGGMANLGANPDITGCVFSKNTSAAGGGGMFNLMASPAVTRCTFTENSSGGNGGGMLNDESSPSVTDCAFYKNRVQGEHVYGGGMSNENSSSPAVKNCTFETNSAVGTAAGGGGMSSGASLPTVINCTFSNNYSTKGGGIIGTFAKITHCTVTGNIATQAGGGITTTETVGIIKNTIIAGNTGGDYPDIFPGSIPSGGYNLIGNVGAWQDFYTNTTGDQYGDPNNTTEPNTGAVESPTAIDPKLGALADNGGYTKTHALLPGSPAIDAGDNTDAPDTDQRGITRIVGTIDIGSVEDASALPFVSIEPGTAPDETGPVSGTFILTRTGDLTQPLSVSYTLTGTATGADYSNLSSNPIVFAAGSATAVITLNIFSDEVTDPGETVIATLGTGSDYVTGDASAATLTIIADISVYYAAPGADGTGTAWDDPADLRDILNRPLKSGNQIWVQYGTYYPTDTEDPSESFRLTDGVEIYGGFSEFTAATALSDRNPEYYAPCLSGIVPSSGDGTNYVVTADSSVTPAAVLDGFIIMDWEICPIFRNGGNPAVTGCFFNSPWGYNQKAYTAVKDAYVAAQTYFIYHPYPGTEIDIAKLKEAGLVLPDSRIILTAYGGMTDLQITAYHPCGNRLYKTDWTGQIMLEDSEPAGDCGSLPESPDVVSINRVGSERTDAASVDFEVTFSAAVVGVDAGDFELSPSVSGASVSSVSGTGDTYTVSVNTGTGEGTLQLNLADKDSVITACGDQPLGGAGQGNGDFSGQAYIIDRSILTASITPIAPNPRTSSVSSVTIVFTEPVSGFDLTDLSLTRNSGGNLLTDACSLSTTDDMTWTLADIEGLTGAVGSYALTLQAEDSGIQNSSSEMLNSDAAITWSVITETPTTVPTTIPTTIPTTTVPATTTIPAATTTVPAATTTVPAATTTVPAATTTVPAVTTTVPEATTTVPAATTVPATTTVPAATTVPATTTVPAVTTIPIATTTTVSGDHQPAENPVLGYLLPTEAPAPGTSIGEFGISDTDDTCIYTLISGEGDTDNSLFVIEGNVLKLADEFDDDPREENSYTIRVRVSDEDGFSYETNFTFIIGGSLSPDLRDAIQILQLLTGIIQEGFYYVEDVNGDGKIGIEEVIDILRNLE